MLPALFVSIFLFDKLHFYADAPVGIPTGYTASGLLIFTGDAQPALSEAKCSSLSILLSSNEHHS